jgi:hypothetical protein
MGSIENISCDKDYRSLLLKGKSANAINHFKPLCSKNREGFIVNEAEGPTYLPVGGVEEAHRVKHIRVEGSAKVESQM